jgi:hypothetical protein
MTYYVQADTLFYGDEELLTGDRRQLALFAKVLNEASPREDKIAPTIRALFATCPDYSFAPGKRLLSDGTAMRRLARSDQAKGLADG